VPSLPLLSAAARRVNDERMLLGEKQLLRRTSRRAEEIYRAIAAGGSDWLAEVR
jgi:hypothetical protein